MPEKIDYYSSYGQKLITLFAKLLFSGESHSLTELSQRLRCSKQTVLRLVEDIRRSYGVDIEDTIRDNRKYYRMKTNGRIPPVLSLTNKEY
ncbi:MAG TPA: HTH domain-containing protein, partial [Deltaproteobacteria bacterium]|nr:HTH domain-containing protein [Deltaproteobacteria bacterium]